MGCSRACWFDASRNTQKIALHLKLDENEIFVSRISFVGLCVVWDVWPALWKHGKWKMAGNNAKKMISLSTKMDINQKGGQHRFSVKWMHDLNNLTFVTKLKIWRNHLQISLIFLLTDRNPNGVNILIFVFFSFVRSFVLFLAQQLTKVIKIQA